MEALADVATRVVMMVTQGILTTAVVLLMICAFDLRIGGIAILGVLLVFAVNSHFQKNAKELAPVKDASDRKLVEKVLEYIQGIAEVKPYNLAGEKSKALHRAIDENTAASIQSEITFVPIMFLQSLTAKLIGVVIAAASVAFYLNGTMELLNAVVMVIAAFILFGALDSAGSYSALLRGEGGASLSGGEKQRISIARAIMKDAPIVILDEATANVDPESEQELTAAIEALTKEKTILMIAHRLKTVRHADGILVIGGGMIVQSGTHDELMEQGGIYRRFVESRELAVGWKV